jgi:hypothetical protein
MQVRIVDLKLFLFYLQQTAVRDWINRLSMVNVQPTSFPSNFRECQEHILGTESRYL